MVHNSAAGVDRSNWGDEDTTMTTYYKIDYLGDGTLLGLFHIDHNREGRIVSYETFNRRTHQWVDDPSNSAYVFTERQGPPRSPRMRPPSSSISCPNVERAARSMTGQPTTCRTYYRVDSLRDRTVPVGLFRINHDEQGHITSCESFNRRTCQWVDDPSLSGYVFKGEPGATRITKAEAADLERRLCRALDR
jgi:hypothetical protein